jgi:outer membrane protein
MAHPFFYARAVCFFLVLAGGWADGFAAETAAPAPAAKEARSKFYTVYDLYRIAQQRSEALQITREEIKAAEARYWQAVSAILPQVDFTYNAELRSRVGSGGEDSSGNRSRDSSGGRFRATQQIFSGFREFNLVGAGKAEARALGYDWERARQVLYLDVSNVYYQILNNERDLAVLEQLSGALTERDKELDRRVGLGRSRKGDLLAGRTELAQVLVAKEQVKGLREAAKELLAYLTGIPAAQLQVADPGDFPAAPQLQAYLAHKLNRPDLLAGLQRGKASERVVAARTGEYFPTVSVEGNYYTLEAPRGDQDWNVFLTVSVPIFEGGLTTARVQESRANLRAVRLDLQRLERLADNEIRTAYVRFTAATAQLFRLREADAAAVENYRVQQEDYRIGRASNLDVLSALTQLQQVRRQLVAVDVEARAALAELQVAAGIVEEKKP